MAIFAELGVETERAAVSLSVYGADGGPRFVSPTLRPPPLLTRRSLQDLTGWRKVLVATLWLRRRGDATTTWGAWAPSLGLPARFVQGIAEPVAAAFNGVTFEQLPAVSASAALVYPALATLGRGAPSAVMVRGGTQRWIGRIAGRIGRVRLRLGDPVRRVTPRG